MLYRISIMTHWLVKSLPLTIPFCKCVNGLHLHLLGTIPSGYAGWNSGAYGLYYCKTSVLKFSLRKFGISSGQFSSLRDQFSEETKRFGVRLETKGQTCYLLLRHVNNCTEPVLLEQTRPQRYAWLTSQFTNKTTWHFLPAVHAQSFFQTAVGVRQS